MFRKPNPIPYKSPQDFSLKILHFFHSFLPTSCGKDLFVLKEPTRKNYVIDTLIQLFSFILVYLSFFLYLDSDTHIYFIKIKPIELAKQREAL